MPDFVYGDLQVTFLNTKYAQMAKMWDTRTAQESKFKHILQHIPVKNIPSISILKKTNLKFNNNPFPLLYYCHLHDWDYTKAPIHRREEYYTYRIRKSEDGNDIENFDIAINSRGFGDPPYEGPEYEKYINHLD